MLIDSFLVIVRYDIRIYPNRSRLDSHFPHLVVILYPEMGPGGLGVAGAAAEKVVLSRFAEFPGRGSGRLFLVRCGLSFLSHGGTPSHHPFIDWEFP